MGPFAAAGGPSCPGATARSLLPMAHPFSHATVNASTGALVLVNNVSGGQVLRATSLRHSEKDEYVRLLPGETGLVSFAVVEGVTLEVRPLC